MCEVNAVGSQDSSIDGESYNAPEVGGGNDWKAKYEEERDTCTNLRADVKFWSDLQTITRGCGEKMQRECDEKTKLIKRFKRACKGPSTRKRCGKPTARTR